MHEYKQLTRNQRYQIQTLLKAEIGKIEIADIIGVYPTIIYRELDRNSAKRGRTAGNYVAKNAQRPAVSRHKCKPKQVLLTEVMKERIAGLLCFEKWSPVLISKRLELEGEICVSHETIYQWIWDVKKSKKKAKLKYSKLYKSLRHGSRRQKRGNTNNKRGAIKGRVGIEERPDVVDHRERVGDIEVDPMMGSGHKLALLVMTDRTTLVTILEKLKGKEAQEVYEKMEERLTNFSSSWIKTITFGNGKEFAKHQKKGELLNAKTYFTRPYTLQDKGTVENRIV
uniref:IS30 family transposase n=1 Tax=Nonlabens sp. Ci31 TaxID=2608253 RepID=UPI0014752899|nr:IS30 family transposase [Nonlabens sp. Ci31]